MKRTNPKQTPPEIRDVFDRHASCFANDVRIGNIWDGLVIVPIVLGTFTVGCGSAQTKSILENWVEKQDGLTKGDMGERAVRIGAALASETFSGKISVSVLGTQTVGGFAWPDGHIYVTRGLLEIASDDELSAAIAHEMGHLLADHGSPTLVALAGRSACDAGCEERADAIGCLLLRVKGKPPGAMITLLRKVEASPQTNANLRPSIERRIKRLIESSNG